MPTEVGIHDSADADGEVMDGGPSPAMTLGHGPVRHGFGRLVLERRLSAEGLAAWYQLRSNRTFSRSLPRCMTRRW
jgi:hypothetical protein